MPWPLQERWGKAAAPAEKDNLRPASNLAMDCMKWEKRPQPFFFCSGSSTRGSHHAGTAAVFLLCPWKCFAFLLASRSSQFCDAEPQYSLTQASQQHNQVYFFFSPPYKICKIEVKVPVSPGPCKIPVITMTFGLRFRMGSMKSATAMYSILHCY